MKIHTKQEVDEIIQGGAREDKMISQDGDSLIIMARQFD
jgi:hypothetical protein